MYKLLYKKEKCVMVQRVMDKVMHLLIKSANSGTVTVYSKVTILKIGGTLDLS